MDFVTHESNVKLIKQIKLRPCLYNKNLLSYTRKDSQENAWEDVAKRMGMGWKALQCKERWRNLRSVYLRHVKAMSKGVHKRPYYLTKAMSFILPFLKQVDSNSLPKEIMDILQGDDDMESVAIDDVEEEQGDTRKSFESQSPKRRMGSESPESSPSFLTKFAPSTTVEIKHEDINLSDSNLSSIRNNDSQSQGTNDWEESKIGVSNGYEVEMPNLSSNTYLKNDARKMFLYSLLPDVYAMTDAQMRQFKLKVLNAIGDILDSIN